jgi:hypothetical protein
MRLRWESLDLGSRKRVIKTLESLPEFQAAALIESKIYLYAACLSQELLSRALSLEKSLKRKDSRLEVYLREYKSHIRVDYFWQRKE